MTDVSVRPVSGESDYQAFLRMPWTVYKDVPEWTAPLWKEHVEYFQPEHNPELLHIDIEKFIAWRGDTPVGTILAFVNHAYNTFHEVNVGWFGQFELLDDAEAARALLDTASEWLRAKNVDAIMGPATFSTNSEIGLLVDGYEYAPMILTTHAQRYYKGFIEDYGFDKEMDMYCWYFDGSIWGGKKADKIPEKLTRITGKLQKRRNFTVRSVNMRDFDNEIGHVKRIYNSAWDKNWGFIPFTDGEIDHLAAGLKQMVDPNVALFAEVDGEPVAFGLGPTRYLRRDAQSEVQTGRNGNLPIGPSIMALEDRRHRPNTCVGDGCTTRISNHRR